MKFIVIRLTILTAILFLSPTLFPSTLPAKPGKSIPVDQLYKKISSMKLRDFQKLSGRKLTLKEKISFGILKHKIKKNQKNDKGAGNGQLSLILGIAGLAFFVSGVFLPALFIPSLVSAVVAVVLGSVAKKQNPNDRKAHAGKLLGWITLGLLTLLTILAIIALASWDWG